MGLNFTYLPTARLLLSGGYQFLRIHSNTDILFFRLFELTQGRSIYQSEIHLGYAQLLLPVGSRLQLRIGYQLIRDHGLSFPLKRETPRVGLSFFLFKSLHWESDWRHISYNQTEKSGQNYRVNLVTTSLKWLY